MADEIEKICPICGKRFGVLHPDLWVYKKQKNGRTIYFCRYTCYRTDEKKEEEMNKAEMDKRDLIMTVLDNVEVGHSAAETLKDAGHENARIGWGCLRKWARQNAPDLVARMEKVLIEPTKKAEVSKVETVPPVEKQNAAPLELQGGVNYELKVDEAMKKPGFMYKVTGIDTEIGGFMLISAEKIKWIPGNIAKEDQVMQLWSITTEPVLTIEQWRKLAEVIPEVIRVLTEGT